MIALAEDLPATVELPLRDRVLAYLADQYEPSTAGKIAAALGTTKRRVMFVLRTLAFEGSVACVHEGSSHPNDPTLWV